MNNFNEYTSDDFVHDDHFIEWVLRPTQDNMRFWNEVIKQNPEKEPEINIAYSVIKAFSTKSEDISRDEIDDLWKSIKESTFSAKKSIFFNFRYISAAVIFLGVFTVGWWLYRALSSTIPEINYSRIEPPEFTNNNVSLYLTDNSELKIQDKESTLIYNPEGDITINVSEHVSQPVKKVPESKLLLNQVVVPYGKRTSIIFSDGTKVWVNSGSRAIYPVEFDLKKREIWIEGEVYFDVTKDQNKPFIVKTDKLEIEVLGTSFNVSSYPDEAKVSVVLVSGSVKIKSENKKEIKIEPNQQLIYTKNTKDISLHEVDIYDFISWKDGWLKCNSEEISSVINKLARYYNRKFEFRDTSMRNLHFSGKLDLKEDFEQVLKVLTIAAPLVFEVENEVIYIKYDII